MFERFTERVRRVIVHAQEEARLLHHDHIGTEHLLIGLIVDGEGVAARALAAVGVDDEAARRTVVDTVGRGTRPPSGHIPFTPRAKRSLEHSLREALRLGHNYIGTEHILLGLLRESDGAGAQCLARLGVERQRLEGTILEMLEAEPNAGWEGAHEVTGLLREPGAEMPGGMAAVVHGPGPLLVAALLAVLLLLAAIAASVADDPLSGLGRAGSIALLVGVVASVLAAVAGYAAPRIERAARWLGPAAAGAFAAAAVLLILDNLVS